MSGVEPKILKPSETSVKINKGFMMIFNATTNIQEPVKLDFWHGKKQGLGDLFGALFCITVQKIMETWHFFVFFFIIPHAKNVFLQPCVLQVKAYPAHLSGSTFVIKLAQK